MQKKTRSTFPVGWFPKICARDITPSKAELPLQELKSLAIHLLDNEMKDFKTIKTKAIKKD
ncbi:hypothetical protein Ciccas_004898 [Cichlidogyrus casuarinus]|uniref:Uncharacterized protein n=1 Tax=Cichlidogyrus casuarinus TaxID=1844966 RepID=A0ABD2QA67_9PLAT